MPCSPPSSSAKPCLLPHHTRPRQLQVPSLEQRGSLVLLSPLLPATIVHLLWAELCGPCLRQLWARDGLPGPLPLPSQEGSFRLFLPRDSPRFPQHPDVSPLLTSEATHSAAPAGPCLQTVNYGLQSRRVELPPGSGRPRGWECLCLPVPKPVPPLSLPGPVADQELPNLWAVGLPPFGPFLY